MADKKELKDYTEGQVFQIIRKIVAQKLGEMYGIEDFKPDSDLETEFDADSLDKIEIEMEIERKFNVDAYGINEKFKTINDIMDYLRKNYGFKDSPKTVVVFIMTARQNQSVITQQKKR